MCTGEEGDESCAGLTCVLVSKVTCLPQSFVQRKVGRFAPPQPLLLCNTVCTSADPPCRHLTEQQVFLPQCIHHPSGILWRHSGCRILITVQCYSPAASGNLAYHALTGRGCERQVKVTSGAAGAVGAPRGCQAPAGQKPASASELSEARQLPAGAKPAADSLGQIPSVDG